MGWDAIIGQKLTSFSSFLIDLFFKIKRILMQCKKSKLKRPNGVKMAPRLKSVFFGSQNLVIDCQNLLFFNLFTINCLCISFLSYLWVSHNPSISVTRKKNPKGLAYLLIFKWTANFKHNFRIFL